MDQPRILVVEDDATIRRLVFLLAKRRAIHAVTVATCEEALRAVAEDDSFALILMDWGLPDKSGLECTALIRSLHVSRRTWLPIIAMTGNLLPGDRQTCLQSGMDDFIGKPFSLNDFNDLMDRWLNYRTNVVNFVEPPAPEPDEPRAGIS